MKKNVMMRAALLAAITLGLAVSCAKEITQNVEEGIDNLSSPTLIRADIPEEITKVSLTPGESGVGLNLAWEAGDQLTVIGNSTEQFTIDEGFTATTAEFSGNPVEGSSFTIIYPGQTYQTVASINARSYTSQVQIGNANTDHLEWNAMIENVSDYSGLNFAGAKQNGALKFHLQLPADFTKVYSVSLSAPSAIFSIDNGDSDKVSELTLTLKDDASTDGITLGSDKILTAYMMVSWNENAIAAGTELTIKAQGDQQDPWTKVKTVGEDGFTIAGGKVTGLKLNNSDWDEPLFWGGSGTQADPYQIKTVRNLQNITTLEKTADVYCVLIDDIALSSAQAAEFTEIKDFWGFLDGDNHTITGLTTPLFGSLYGSVKDIDITANINFNGTNTAQYNGTDYGIGILAHYIYRDSAKNPTNSLENVTVRGSLVSDGVAKTHNYMVGGMVGADNGAPMTGCRNYANVTIQNMALTNSTSLARVGGITGALQSAGSVIPTNCENHGDIEVVSASMVGTCSVGGVFGFSTQAITITNCDNFGDVTITDATTTAAASSDAHIVAGGVLANMNTAVTLSGCDNSGAVSIAKATTNNNVAVGGVVGYSTSRFTITNCDNASTGTVTLTSACNSTSISAVGVGGVVGWATGQINMSGCDNHADVTDSAGAAGSFGTGGVMGKCSTTGKDNGGIIISNCTNDGAVLDNSAYTTAKGHFTGGIAGHLAGAAPTSYDNIYVNVSDCTNDGTVTLSAAAGAWVRVGGIVGLLEKMGNFSNCENKKTISVSTPSTVLYAAGGVGHVSKCGNFDGMINHGDVIITGKATDNLRVGGIIGNNVLEEPFSGAANPRGTLKNSLNDGSISVTSANTSTVYLGGLVGGCTSGAGYVLDSENRGDVTYTVTGGVTLSRLDIGGVAGYYGTAGGKLDGNKSNCAVSCSGTITTVHPKQILGFCGSGSTFTVSNNKVAGSVQGTTITAENYTDYIAQKTSGTFTDFDTNSFWSE